MMKVLFLDIDGVLNYESCTSFYGGVYFVTEEKESFEAGLTEALLDTLENWNLYIFD